MSDSPSHRYRPPLYHDPQRDGSRDAEPGKDGSREQQGWEAYRKWLASVNTRPKGRRAPVDHSVYSWKGYHSWADRVRQSWKPEEN
jgi:hypothetical protein